ncbi:cytochrome d ubiquinol oxidase subunit II [Conexibacter sp. JD483]|uniref:cytochrome d ubiquinol oxidase subunit II n=1 Tax=unclassified Conexibacter TaxID=2627773 RepID=UPI002727928D|nr:MULTISPECIES: cytochrome d ubiquinol oxidase subunit II [unclassified Conexibacter]MDO8184569.1 cytochrome d ubiquinol oxidase subunit II [Conexibacter sp. CPCC 205706]MDO8197875.1 cytochrome d ubiquinol oxidase subunit II [Conexibacter sp. CPCC 205762]MDR9370079.1 cytochrome d ubiquinol oxidase subunit II [Conexibacter sp. JD483]
MHLYAVPLLFALIGMVLYVVLAGADFGAGFWQLVAGRGEHGRRVREHAHESMAPVWEANHVWLIFVLVVMWTCYPEAFASIASTLSIPLFVAALGIVFRGAAYALRAGTAQARELRVIDSVFAVASILTPFALGTVVGGIASGRVPVGNAAGDQWSSWLNPTSVTIGLLAVALSAYLAAVYLAADAVRRGDAEMERAFRLRALVAGLVAGGMAAGALVVLRDDTRTLFDALLSGAGLAAVIVSALAGLGTLLLVRARSYEYSRYSAAVAVAAIVAGWAIAQSPELLPGAMTVEQAAAGDDTLIAVVAAVLAGLVVLAPSLGLLFTLTLRGSLGHGGDAPAGASGGGAGLTDEWPTPVHALSAARNGLLARGAIAFAVLGFAFLTVANAGWAHAIGVPCLFASALLGFRAAVPSD